MNRADSTLQQYLDMLGSCPQLSREAEADLWQAWRRDGDARSCDQLMRANLQHVVLIAFKYRRYGLPIADLISEGNFGIVCALQRFDPERGHRFLTYAAYWVRAQILRYIIRSWSIVGTDSGALRSKMFFKLRRERARVYCLLGEGEQAHEALAQRLNLPVERVKEYEHRLASRDASLDGEAFHDDGPRLVDTLVSPDFSQEEEYLLHQQKLVLSKLVRTAVERLDRRERFVLEASLMCDDDETLSLAEIGRRLGVSRERTRQLGTRALKKLRGQILKGLGPAKLEFRSA